MSGYLPNVFNLFPILKPSIYCYAYKFLIIIILHLQSENLYSQYSFGDSPLSYGKAIHEILGSLYLGSLDTAYIQSSYLPSTTASTAVNDNGINNGILPLHEGFIDLNSNVITLAATNELVMKIQATNNEIIPAKIYAWLDFNRNGKFDPNEYSIPVEVPTQTQDSTFELKWKQAGSRLLNGTTYLRVRLTTEILTSVDASAFSANGEVEDYQLNLKCVSFTKTVGNENGGSITAIGDTLIYTLRAENHLKVDRTYHLEDILPEDVSFIAGNGVSIRDTLIGTKTFKKLILASQIIPAKGFLEFKFKVQVNDLPEEQHASHKIYNQASLANQYDTIYSSINCFLAERTIDKLSAKNDYYILPFNGAMQSLDIRLNDTDPFGTFRGSNKIITSIITHPQKGTTSLTTTGLLNYTPIKNKFGKDILNYRIQTGNSQADAKVQLAIIKPVKFDICKNTKGNIQLEVLDGVEYLWYKKQDDLLPIHRGNDLVVNIADADTFFYIEADFGGKLSNRLAIQVKAVESLVYPDIRIKLSKDPNRLINLASFLDTIINTTGNLLSWKKIQGIDIDVNNEINTADIQNAENFTLQYIYSINNGCGTSKAKLYLSNVKQIHEEKQISVCKSIGNKIFLQQVLGIEATGSWSFHADLIPYVKQTNSKPAKGALVFDAKEAYDGIKAIRKAVFTYHTNSASSLKGKSYVLIVNIIE